MRGRSVVLAGLAVVLAVGFVYLRTTFFYLPDPVVDAERHCPADTPPVPVGRPLKVLVWNVQYGASREPHFFYDGGDDVAVPPELVSRTLDGMEDVLRREAPDLVLWQELDRGSDRIGGVDQLEAMLERTEGRFPCWAAAPYHKVGFVPLPLSQPLGRVHMDLAVFSRFRLGAATRHQLALLREPMYRQLFNLRRAVLRVEVQTERGPPIVLLNTHLSAFSNGDGTLPRQVEQVEELALDAERAGQPWLLAGDFNALPPGDDPTRLASEDGWGGIGDAVTPMQRLYDHLKPALPLETYRADPSRWFTYLPWGASAPDRTIDYVFHGTRLRLNEFAVRQDRLDISDHLPLVAVVELPAGP